MPKIKGAATVDIFGGTVQTKGFRVLYGVISGSLEGFFGFFSCMDAGTSVQDILSMFLEFYWFLIMS